VTVKINKEILRLAIPNVISNISVPLLSSVDTALMGRLSAMHIGAVGLGAMIFNVIYWNFGFLRMGTTGITAQAYGRKDDEMIMQTLSRGLLLAGIIVVLLLLFQKPIGELSFQLMNVADEQMALVSEYFFIRIWAAPASIMLFAFLGWYFGIQNAIIPLILTILINVVNIGLSYLFVHYYQWGVAGVAWGTVIAQYVGLIFAAFFFLSQYRYLLKSLSRTLTLELSALLEYLKINRDIFIRTICLTFVFGFFYSQSSKAGGLILAVNVVLLQFVNWMSYGIDGFAYASESLVGKYKGAESQSNLNKVIKFSFIWAFSLAVIYALLYFAFGEYFLTIFTDKQAVLDVGGEYVIWMVLFPIVATASYIWDGIYIGLTASKAMMLTMIFAVLVFILSFALLKTPYQNHGIWAAMIIFMLARSLSQWFYYNRYLRVSV